MASAPVYEGTPFLVTQVISSGNTSRTGAGILTPLIVGGVNPAPGGVNSTIGTRVDNVVFQWQNTSAVGNGRLFVGGVLYNEFNTTAITTGVGTVGFRFAYQNMALVLPPGVPLTANINNSSETVGIIVNGGLL